MFPKVHVININGFFTVKTHPATKASSLILLELLQAQTKSCYEKTCLQNSFWKINTNQGRSYYKSKTDLAIRNQGRRYYKQRQVIISQIRGRLIRNWGRYFKLDQFYWNWYRYCKLGQQLQLGIGHLYSCANL